MSGKGSALSALAVLVFSIAALVYAGTFGPASRSWPKGMVIRKASTAGELINIWAGSGAKGLRVVNMSSYLNYREPESFGKTPLVTPEGNAFRSIGLNHSHTLTSSNYDEITADMKSMGFNSGDYQGPSWQWNRIPYSKGIRRDRHHPDR